MVLARALNEPKCPTCHAQDVAYTGGVFTAYTGGVCRCDAVARRAPIDWVGLRRRGTVMRGLWIRAISPIAPR